MLQTETTNPLLPVRFLNEKKAAARLDVNFQTLTRWRREGRGPKFLKLYGRVKYRESDIEQFIAANVVDPAAAAIQRKRARRRRRTAA
jgi:predicted site-specific integrase-resolvase